MYNLSHQNQQITCIMRIIMKVNSEYYDDERSFISQFTGVDNLN
jgi:hypothetical protein